MMPNCFTALLLWPAKRWLAAGGVAIATFLLIGVPTAVIPNPVFGRSVEVTPWSTPVLLVTAVLTGLLFATYVRVDSVVADEVQAKIGGMGSFLAYLAVGCPVCNKLALIALGSTGAIRYFAPVQPYLAVAGIGLLLYALRQRLVNEASCKLPLRTFETSTENKLEESIN